MPTPTLPDLKFAIGLPPERAMAYLKAKGYEFSFDWHEVLAEAQVKSFTVAKAMKLDVLSTVREEVQKALDQGLTLRDFQKNLTPRLQALGWWGKQEMVNPATGEVKKAQLGSPQRLRTIYQTNMQTAYMAGRYREQMANATEQPWWMYVAILDARTRPSHRALHGRVFKYNDPFWGSMYPPNGWNCRCRVRAMDGDTLKDKGLKPQTAKDRMTMEDLPVSRDGRTAQAAVFTDSTGRRIATDPGWGYNPGKAWMEGMGPKLASSLQSAPKDAADAALKDLANSKGFKDFYQKPEGLWPVLRLDSQAATAIKAENPVAMLSADSMTKNKANHPDLELEDYQKLPDLGDPDLIIQDGAQSLVLFRKHGKWYLAAVKSTQSGQRTFLMSFRQTKAEDVERLKKSGKILFEK